ncbi:hypothetical protein J7W08_11270 [Methanococcoides orientis]|uniref:hypothetical protein n=1 Tax=Methanococcoides orientis TaxID=2822137 RepID=UPI001E2E1832|nr:hypothetical protein [Methanococcoides orientis]UGV40616.1 hypothetical protein J7W08_11270 [Methanococcoides orientis]
MNGGIIYNHKISIYYYILNWGEESLKIDNCALALGGYINGYSIIQELHGMGVKFHDPDAKSIKAKVGGLCSEERIEDELKDRGAWCVCY